MSVFKDMVTQDRDILLNPDELGEPHVIDDEKVVCVIDDDTLQAGSVDGFAFSKSTKMLYAKSEDLPPKRGYGSQIMVDGIPYMVQTWDETMGMTAISLAIAYNA